jgi:hypothetical protein
MFKINQIVLDMYSKEYVLITNGTDAEGFKPTEAIALRVMGEHKGRQIVGYTYRKVEEKQLQPVAQTTTDKLDDMFNLHKRKTKYWIGRI